MGVMGETFGRALNNVIESFTMRNTTEPINRAA